MLFSQHTIKGKLLPAKDYTYAFLYKSNPSGSSYVTKAQLEENGTFKIELDSTATAGIYKIVYALPPEENNFDLIYNAKEDIELVFNSDEEESLKFIASIENKLWTTYRKDIEEINQNISQLYSNENLDKTAFNTIFELLKVVQNDYEKASTLTIAHKFITSNKPYIPSQFEDLNIYAKNLKTNYLKHINFQDEFIQSSDFLTDKVLAYMFGTSANTTNETYKNNIDNLLKTIGNYPKTQSNVLELIWSRMVQLNNETVANYITDKYLLELSKQLNDDILTEALTVYKNNSIGQKAQNFAIENLNTTLHDLNNASNYLIVFWSSTCGHCLEELPELKQLLFENKTLKIIAIGLEEDDINWKKEIENYPNFIHVLGLEKWQNTISKSYSVYSTPSYFILNKEKIIVAKPENVQELKDYKF